jgi:hypothetical protein
VTDVQKDVQKDVLELDMCRIFICDERNQIRSQCWYFRSEGNEVYIGPGPTGGTSKLSFHSRGGSSRDGCDSQWGLTRPYAERERQLGTAEVLLPVRWKRPLTPSVGVVQVASILFPTDFLRGTIPAFKSGRKRVALLLASPHHAIEIGVFYSFDEPSIIRINLNNAKGKFIGYMSLPNGENVVIAAREVPFDPAIISGTLELGCAGHLLSGAPAVGEVNKNSSALMLHHRPADGEMATLAEINGIPVKRDNQGLRVLC